MYRRRVDPARSQDRMNDGEGTVLVELLFISFLLCEPGVDNAAVGSFARTQRPMRDCEFPGAPGIEIVIFERAGDHAERKAS